MISAKRLSLQLTPLLDLLLIVIFAQYLEIEQTTVADTAALAAQQAQQAYKLEQATEQLAFTKTVLNSVLEIKGDAEQQLAELMETQKVERIASDNRQQELASKLQDVSRQRDRIIAALQDVYASSSEEIKKLLEKLVQAATTPLPISPEKISELADQMAQSQPRDLATFLLAYEEIRKRCDIWELHLDPQGLIQLFDGKQRYTFRATSAAEFQRQLFDLYKSLPQTKSLVIILVSYGETRADLRQFVLGSLPAVTERMRSDADGRTRFEYAVVGYLPLDPPPLPKP